MKRKKRKIYIFDTTLRDGEQCPGASLTADEKLQVARQLERLGVDIIEAGFPAASPGEIEAIQAISKEVTKPVICALARMVSQDIDAAREALKYAKKKRLHVFLATSKIHREFKLKKRKSEILKLAQQQIKYAGQWFKDIQFSPEDASRTEREFLADAVWAAIDSGATTINIPDTVGYALPKEFGELIAWLIKKIPGLGKKISLAVHCHNDLGLAVANSLQAVMFGANQVECTMNGIGERAGNASMEEIVMAIDTRRDLMNVYTDIKVNQIIKSSRLVSHLTGLAVQPNKAIVGRNAFAHESGIHQDGVLKKRQTYEIIDPKRIGLSGSEMVMGKHSGRHAFRERLVKLGIVLNSEDLNRAFERFKRLCDQKKYVFDQDIEAIVEEEVSKIPETWKLEYTKISSETGVVPSATVRLSCRGEIKEASSEGDGPVDACYKAIEKATGIEATLVNYSIQSVTSGKDALGEVNIKMLVNGKEIGGRATSTDVIEASVKAYLFVLNKVQMHQGGKSGLPI
ncbi:MAG: 2-isopropylmalate synthase [Omnitrophica bacterium RIFCSPLOWO2_12_FULL_44_17]|uniref:2-isopropylmalate synthase n=1 Tax=Candidatus Danuiimicrobium aquiferis TaxID=1801832 RepID=A0A1G1L1X9_9BACT|nr:MAG: 2-isopropylmalate synthase [Omnitrophica bacterium RIFCSPHIGHO2_02_FULL_45_28]OGW92488.1 MAG: 2-isopropylmalate synthase [Omnitrophica bacterium RIFCSPHIGHO2_12_FULL_44_12]OGW99151.1 MAG: 2-isopropylmalate synthase [Omnitrophica bacterium RIFCSPLOWO2_12_FULL_44_17]OGX04439.1 MAG: 2-isopropylmalate synthase [Omnitrophica bacterium RIFCSPLOWO2_02_FULL_44_11]